MDKSTVSQSKEQNYKSVREYKQKGEPEGGREGEREGGRALEGRREGSR